MNVLRRQFSDLPLIPGNPAFRMAQINTKEEIYTAIKKFLGKGK